MTDAGEQDVPHPDAIDHGAADQGGTARGAEATRLAEDASRDRNWKRWGPYLADRQWGTVREDYSADGDAWAYLPHDHARSRAYRWGEDGLLGVCDREGRLCFGLALWNGEDPILKERLFGLSGPEGNHGEDVKEAYFYLDATPTSSYLRALYKYPQRAFPYAALVDENARRSRTEREYELADTAAFAENRYWDVTAEYAKAGPDDLLIRLTVANRGPDAAALDVLPSLWFRNTWAWGRGGAPYTGTPDAPRPRLARLTADRIAAQHPTLGRFVLVAGPAPDGGAPNGGAPELLFTENATNAERLFGAPNAERFTKDAFDAYVVRGEARACNPDAVGTKAAARYHLRVPAGGEVVLRLRLAAAADGDDGDPLGADALGAAFDGVFARRAAEADAFYDGVLPAGLAGEERRVARQAYAGLLWSKQCYHYAVHEWLEGDHVGPPAPPSRRWGRNADWTHLYNSDVLSMPDAWEYPWYAAWDLAFHMLPMARVDPAFAKSQLVLLLREWYMHPNGQIPAYEWNFGDVNPPVHAWAAWRVYKMTGERGQRDRVFLARVFQKLLLNFTWWVNRKDPDGRNLFAGGFLGLDNIGVFDRSKPLPTGGRLEQADGTAWMAFYCTTMLAMALELAAGDPAYEDVASKFFEHFVAISDAVNTLGGTGLWDDADGFYYDQLETAGASTPIRVRSLVGVVPLFACEVLEQDVLERLPGFSKRLQWLLDHRPDLTRYATYMATPSAGADGTPHRHRLLALASRERLERVLQTVLDEEEFLSPYGVRSLSRVHADRPYVLHAGGQEYSVAYEPGESTTGLFGGNSNWRGPVWLPLNWLLIEALERYGHFYGDTLRVEYPTRSGRTLTLAEVARELSARLSALFLPDAEGARPCHGGDAAFARDPHWRDLVLFYEHFHGDDGRGLGASHQTGWTALVAQCLENVAATRAAARAPEARGA